MADFIASLDERAVNRQHSPEHVIANLMSRHPIPRLANDGTTPVGRIIRGKDVQGGICPGEMS